MSDAEGRLDDARMYGSLRERRGDGYETNADERSRERAEAVEARMFDTLWANRWNCPECAHKIMPMGLSRHLRECELLRARAEAECDAAERAR